MAIRVSSSKQIDALIEKLGSPDAMARDAAVARLTVIGTRAVDRLLTTAQSKAAAAARIAAWAALDAIGDTRALEPALKALDDRDAVVAAAAAAVARRFVRGAHGAAVVDRLTAIVLDRRRDEIVRTAALHALDDLEAATTAPLRRALADDPSERLRRASSGGRQPGDVARGPQRNALKPASARLAAAADGTLPRDPGALRTDLLAEGDDTALPLLVRLIDRIREHEGAEPAASRPPWTAARATAHLALAKRGSRLALYDIRETLESARGPLPVELLQALVIVGDATVLEAVAIAHEKAQDAWSRRHLADAFYEILARERLTAGSVLLRKIAKRAPALARRPGGSGRSARSGGPGGSGRSGGSGTSDPSDT